MNRALRRHRLGCKVAQRQRYWGHQGEPYGYWMKTTGTICSCGLCRNPRRLKGCNYVTLQEERAHSRGPNSVRQGAPTVRGHRETGKIRQGQGLSDAPLQVPQPSGIVQTSLALTRAKMATGVSIGPSVHALHTRSGPGPRRVL